MAEPVYSVGLDLGQAQDYTALALVERSDVGTGAWETRGSRYLYTQHGHVSGSEPIRQERTEAHYAVRHLERFPLGTSYPAIVGRVTALLGQEPLAGGNTTLAIDATGVGAPVVDLFLAAGLSALIRPVTITGGDTETYDERTWRVPKRNLVSTLAVLLQSERLRVAQALPEAAILVQELLNFRVKVSLAGHDSYGAGAEWRAGNHDDLVLAAALACWSAEIPVPKIEIW
jgi:hypothetical protein